MYYAGIEATLHWAWLHDRLTEAGYEVEVAHPQQVKLISQARCKTGPIDARKLADLLRTNLLPAIWVPDAETRAARRLLSGRGRFPYPSSQVSKTMEGSDVNPDSELRMMRPSGRNATASPWGSRRVRRFTRPSSRGRSSSFSVTVKNSSVS